MSTVHHRNINTDKSDLKIFGTTPWRYKEIPYAVSVLLPMPCTMSFIACLYGRL